MGNVQMAASDIDFKSALSKQLFKSKANTAEK
jgi:hypothetical protein